MYTHQTNAHKLLQVDGILTNTGALSKAIENASGQRLCAGLQQVTLAHQGNQPGHQCYVYLFDMQPWIGDPSLQVQENY